METKILITIGIILVLLILDLIVTVKGINTYLRMARYDIDGLKARVGWLQSELDRLERRQKSNVQESKEDFTHTEKRAREYTKKVLSSRKD